MFAFVRVLASRRSWTETGDGNNLDDGPAKPVVAIERHGTIDAGAWRDGRAQALPGHDDLVAWRADSRERLDTTAPADHRADGCGARELATSLESVAPFARVARNAHRGAGTVGWLRVAHSHRARGWGRGHVGRCGPAARAQARRHVIQKNQCLRARVRFHLGRL